MDTNVEICFLKDYSSRLLTIFDRTNVYRWCGDEFVIVKKDTNDINITKRIDEIALLTKNIWETKMLSTIHL